MLDTNNNPAPNFSNETLLIDLTKTVSKMEGILSQVVTQQQSQINGATVEIAKVKVVADANAITIAAHAVEIANVKSDVAGIESEKQGALAKAMSVISPFIAGGALLLVIFKDLYAK